MVAAMQVVALVLCVVPVVRMGSPIPKSRKLQPMEDDICNGTSHLLNVIKLINVTESSRFEDRFKSTYVFDDNGRTFTHSVHEVRPWLQLELATRAHISHVSITNRADGQFWSNGLDCAYRTLCDVDNNGGCNKTCDCTITEFENHECGLEIRVGDEPCIRETVTPIQDENSHYCRVNSLAAHVRWSEALVTPPYNASFFAHDLIGRFIDVILPGRRTLSLTEVDVYGCEVSTTSSSSTSSSSTTASDTLTTTRTSTTASTVIGLQTVTKVVQTKANSDILTTKTQSTRSSVTTTSSTSHTTTSSTPAPSSSTTTTTTMTSSSTSSTSTEAPGPELPYTSSFNINNVIKFSPTLPASSSTTSSTRIITTASTLATTSVSAHKSTGDDKSWLQGRVGILILIVLAGIVVVVVSIVMMVHYCREKKSQSEPDDIPTMYMAAKHNVDQIIQNNDDGDNESVILEYHDEYSNDHHDEWDVGEWKDPYEDNFESSV
eukprot:m.38504 g.38504  ORF g.38504 m.38504 type:complete len:491 (-) comp9442_c1_seq1:239-1711(-)